MAHQVKWVITKLRTETAPRITKPTHHIPLGDPHMDFWRRSILLGVTVTVFRMLITGRDLRTKGMENLSLLLS